MAAYANWHQTNLSYGLDYRLSLVAALGFVAALGIFKYPRLALGVSFSLLNVYFAWSSSLLADISQVVGSEVTRAIYSQDGFVSASLNLRVFTGDTYVVADLEALALLAAVTASVLLLNLDKGTRGALLHSVRAAALSLTILGAEVAMFDYREFYLHVTQVQVVLGLTPWFSNADMLFFALATFAVSSCLLRLGWLGAQNYPDFSE